MSSIKSVLLIGGAAGVALGLLAAGVLLRESSQRGKSGSPVTRIDCPCATDYESLPILLRAYEVHDFAAVAGLVSRGHAIQLTAATKVSIDEPLEDLMRPGGRTPQVEIQSGAHVGERCYLWREFIKGDSPK